MGKWKSKLKYFLFDFVFKLDLCIFIKLKSANKKTFLTSFQEQALNDSTLICDLIDAIKPGSIQYGLLKTSGTPEVYINLLFVFVLIYMCN